MKTNNQTKIHLIAGSLALLGTAAFAQTGAPIGPGLEAVTPRDYVGTLVVFTTTEARAAGKDEDYYPHTSYEVFRNGHPFRHVDNGRTLEVETPSRVTLPKGEYTVVAGMDKQPVLIETGRTTVVHLDGN